MIKLMATNRNVSEAFILQRNFLFVDGANGIFECMKKYILLLFSITLISTLIIYSHINHLINQRNEVLSYLKVYKKRRSTIVEEMKQKLSAYGVDQDKDKLIGALSRLLDEDDTLHRLMEDFDKELAYRDDQIKALQAEVERLKSEPTQTVKEVLKQLKAQAETTSKENPPTDGRGGEFDAIWMTDLNGLIEEASWQFQEQAND